MKKVYKLSPQKVRLLVELLKFHHRKWVRVEKKAKVHAFGLKDLGYIEMKQWEGGEVEVRLLRKGRDVAEEKLSLSL